MNSRYFIVILMSHHPLIFVIPDIQESWIVVFGGLLPYTKYNFVAMLKCHELHKQCSRHLVPNPTLYKRLAPVLFQW